MRMEAIPPIVTVKAKSFLRLGTTSARNPNNVCTGRESTPVANAILAPRYRSRCSGVKWKSCAICVRLGAMRFCGDQMAKKARERTNVCAWSVGSGFCFFFFANGGCGNSWYLCCWW